LSAPLSKAEIERLLGSGDEGRRDSHSYMAEMAQIPECQRRPGVFTNMGLCAEKQMALRRERQQRQDTQWSSALPQVAASLRLDLAAVPEHPVTGSRALRALRPKYEGLWQIRERLRTLAVGGTPEAAMARRWVREVDTAEQPLRAAELRQAARPDVLLAYAEGRLFDTDLTLSKVERGRFKQEARWLGAANRLRAQLPGTILFMDRKTEATRSEREERDAARFASWDMPSSTEVGLALLRSTASAGGRVTRPYESEYRAFGGMMVAGWVRILHIERLGCQKSAEGWWCAVRGWYQALMGDAFWESYDANHPFVPVLGALLESSERDAGKVVVHLFKPTPDGWIAPEMLDKVAAAEDRRLQILKDSAESTHDAICLGRQLGGDRQAHLHPSCNRGKR
jgi:hypothetical protein